MLRRKPSAKIKQLDSIVKPGPLPSGGVNYLNLFEGMPKTDAIALINARPNVRGVTVRDGYRAYAAELPGATAVGTLMSYFPASITSFPGTIVDGYIFAATDGEVYDVSAGGSGPWTTMLASPVTSDFWSYTNFQNAGGNYLLACNADGGYYTLVQSSPAALTKIVAGVGAGQINGVDPDLFVFVTEWKQRAWFIEADSTRAWYLPVTQITGTVTQFDFGSHFKHGGFLSGLYNWTIDGGEGIDDYLVAIGSEGDVVIFKGYDPDLAGTEPTAFQLHGVWYAGSLPAGRRSAKAMNGDVYIVTTQGVVQVSRLVAIANLEGAGSTDKSAKVGTFIRDLMKTYASEVDWYIDELPSSDYIFVGTPEVLTNEGVRQLAYTNQQGAWSLFQDLPLKCILDHDHYAFAGSMTGGIVYLLFDDLFDAIDIDGLNGVSILARITPAYSSFELPAMYKVFEMVRPTLLYRYTPEISVSILTDFSSQATTSVASLEPVTGSLWGQAYWNAARWFGTSTPVRKWIGAPGGGYSATVQIDLETPGGTELISLDWWFRQGGPL